MPPDAPPVTDPDFLAMRNEIDALDERERTRLANLWPQAVLISAQTGEGLLELQSAIGEALSVDLVTLSLNVPYDRGDVVAAAHRIGEVIEEKHDAHGTILDVRVPKRSLGRFQEFVV